ncbi:MAG: hypothetical protein ACHREM_27850 [Polyangiales bacterium]
MNLFDDTPVTLRASAALARAGRVLLAMPVLLALDCGGAAKPVEGAKSAPPAAEPEPASSTAAASPATEPVPHAASAPSVEDPLESATPITLEVVMAVSPKLPNATVSDAECWKKVELEGDHAKDFKSLVSKCGAPTGLGEYTKPVEGWLHGTRDKSDDYKVSIRKGYCYRFFAVGDDSTKDIDVRVDSPEGDMVVEDQTTSPAAILKNGATWCAFVDGDYGLRITIDGDAESKGKYTLGVWARPKS